MLGGDPRPRPSEGEPGDLLPHSRGLPGCERRRGLVGLSLRDARRESFAFFRGGKGRRVSVSQKVRYESKHVENSPFLEGAAHCTGGGS